MSKINYYNIEADLDAYPDAWCYIIIGGRATGKTYSTLKYAYENDIRFSFIKRTNKDINFLCAGNKINSKTNLRLDISPFYPINRDIGSNVKPVLIQEGFGAFYNYAADSDDNDSPVGLPIGYLLSLNAGKDIKGFDLSETDLFIMDEFIPQPWERISRKEGEQILDLYKTVARDRIQRGRKALKLIALANATSINNRLMDILEITDDVVTLIMNEDEYLYIEERGILIHLLKTDESFKSADENDIFYKAVKNTGWGQMAYDNTFAYDDFSGIGKISLKYANCICEIQYKNNFYYIYWLPDQSKYYMTSSKSNHPVSCYNLNKNADIIRFSRTDLLKCKLAYMDNRMIFESYSMSHLIVDYKNIFIIK